MDETLIWLIPIVLIVAAFTVIQLKERRYQLLKRDYQRLETRYNSAQEALRKTEFEAGQLRWSLACAGRCKEQLEELKGELKAAKSSPDYLSARRLEYIERYIEESRQVRHPDMIFIETFSPRAVYTFRDSLIKMIEGAEFEINIISPWIKRSTWESVKPALARFAKRGGSLKVFMKGIGADISNGLSDDLHKDVEELGGEAILVKQLHAKIYLVDRREAILTSANLTRGGVEGNFEAGVWSNNPVLLKNICRFVDGLYQVKER